MSGWCGMCGQPLIGHGTVCNPLPLIPTGWTDNSKPMERGHYQFIPYAPTADEIRRIVREELERANPKIPRG